MRQLIAVFGGGIGRHIAEDAIEMGKGLETGFVGDFAHA